MIHIHLAFELTKTEFSRQMFVQFQQVPIGGILPARCGVCSSSQLRLQSFVLVLRN